ncbi:unnamed protein product [Prorocentrum cordatum]|uniref:HECT-type E3 ubiquitin transferase n=1 Tax=Prorocentrum cordatum TaxID=2364126 RepID=A0ABN9WZM3_9DINO|nr:unnamed protein product [Polarella glacialis]
MDAAAAKKRFLRLWQGLQLYDGLSANDAAAAAVPLSQQPPEVAAPLPELLTGEVAPPDGAPPAHEALRRVCAAGAAAEAADVERSLAVLDDLGALAVAFRRGGAEGAGPSVTDPNVDTGAVEAYFHALAARDARASGEADGGAGATGEGGTPQQAKSLVSQALHRLGNLFTKIGHANDQARKFDSDRAAVHGGLAGGVPSSLSGSREAGPVTIPPSPTPLTKEAFRDCSCVGWELPAEPSFRAHVTRFRERREKLKQELAAAAASATGPETQPRLEEPAYNPAECLVGLRVLLIPLAFPFFEESDHYEALGRILRAYRGLSEAQRERLGRWIAGGVLSGTFPFRVLEGQLQWLQQLVTIRFCTDFEEGAEQFGWDFFCTRTSQPVKNALACMDLFFRANRVLQAKHRAFKREERLRGTAAVLQSLGDSAAPPYLKRIDFVNDALNEHDRVLKHDYECSLYLPRLKWNELVQEFRGARMRGLPAQPPPRRPRVPTAMAEVQAGSALNTMSFGLLEYAWALDPSGKCRLLMLNMKDQQRDNVRQEMLTQVFRGHGRVNPYLTLCVRRDNLIQDALQRLASVSPSGLKRTLKVVFEGEQGVDEGGVQKEFFQLLLEQLYDPNFGMFTYNADNKTYWFSHTSLETNLNFELFGVLLGLAIYNRVIIDVRFPIAVYRKLLVADEAGIARFTVDDLGAVAPELARSLEKIC